MTVDLVPEEGFLSCFKNYISEKLIGKNQKIFIEEVA